MAVQLEIDYTQLMRLVEQLPEAEQKKLIVHILTYRAQQRSLTVEEKIQLLEAAYLHNPIHESPSPRREDWYGDDGR